MKNCALCLKLALLRESHLIPSTFYKKIKSENRDAFFIAEDKTFTTSKEIKAPLLCDDCEQKFGITENTISKNLIQRNKTFPLQEKIQNLRMACQISNGTAYDGNEISDLCNDLGYFASSVFWRSSVREWIHLGRTLQRSFLGPQYNEEFRSYLLGNSPFPENARMLVIVSNNSNPSNVFFPPFRTRTNDGYLHRFSLPGVLFVLQISNTFSSDTKDACIMHSPSKPIYLSPFTDELVDRDSIQLISKSQVSKKLKAAYDLKG